MGKGWIAAAFGLAMTAIPRILIIAGSDSGGGAGIQADIKTVTCLGGYAATAITALTAQNTLGVFGVHPVPADFLAQQIGLVLSDIGADAVKTGMLHSAEVIDTVVNALSSPAGGGSGWGHEQAPSPENVTQAPLPASPLWGEERRASSTRDYPIPRIRDNARALRKDMTDAEHTLWRALRHEQLGVKFHKQHPVGPYITDFACIERKVIIEIDGGQHANQAAYDEARTHFLHNHGYRVLRFWNHDVLQNPEGVLVRIKETLVPPRHPLPPQGGGREGGIPSDGISALPHTASPHPTPPPAGEGNIPLIVDPVMVAKGGAPLLEDTALIALRERLIPRAALITPNLPEASLLIGRSIETVGDMHASAPALLALGARAVLLKGGHLAGDSVTDLLITQAGVESFTSPRIDTRHTHGTGCTLASAMAVFIAQGLDLTEATRRARAYVHAAIEAAPGLGKGHGPLWHQAAQG